MRKSDGFTTELVAEKTDAIKLAISHEQEERYLGPLGKRHSIVVGDPSATAVKAQIHPYDEIPTVSADAGRVVQDINLNRIQPSPDNPRKHFDEAELEELTASIRERGVEIPIAVLPAAAFGNHTIIYGERRWRASQAAGKETIPALVLDISDERADEMRFNENHQRRNLTPLEEAAWFQRRINVYGKTVADIAAHSGYSPKTIAKRLRLNSLPDFTKDALNNEALCLGSALAIARLDSPAEMEKVTRTFVTNTYLGCDHDPQKAARYIEREYFTRLAKAPFNVKDVTLIPEAGSCLACPKRTGNQSELFDDVKESDTCLDRKCYDNKCAAQLQRDLDKAEAKGLKILDAQEVKKIAPHGFVSAALNGYVALDQKPYQDNKDRTWKQLLGKDAPVPVVAVIGGEIKHLIPKIEAVEIVKRVHNLKVELPKTERERNVAEKNVHKMRQTVMKETIVALGAWALAHFRERLTEQTPLGFWSLLATMAVKNLRNGGQDYLSKVYELEPEKHPHGRYDYEGALLKKIRGFSTPAHVAAFLVQIIAVDGWHWWTQPGGSEQPYDDHKAMCALIGFDLKAAMKQAKATATAKAKAKKKGA